MIRAESSRTTKTGRGTGSTWAGVVAAAVFEDAERGDATASIATTTNFSKAQWILITGGRHFRGTTFTIEADIEAGETLKAVEADFPGFVQTELQLMMNGVRLSLPTIAMIANFEIMVSGENMMEKHIHVILPIHMHRVRNSIFQCERQSEGLLLTQIRVL